MEAPAWGGFHLLTDSLVFFVRHFFLLLHFFFSSPISVRFQGLNTSLSLQPFKQGRSDQNAIFVPFLPRLIISSYFFRRLQLSPYSHS